MDSLAFTCGELINYSNIARDCGIDSKTVKEYYQILEDTLVGYLIYPYIKRPRRDIISATPKFYCFDAGMPTSLSRGSIGDLRGGFAGKLFENYILTEILAYRGYSEADFEVNFWRAKTGLEVDFIIGRTAVEAKLTERVDRNDLRGLRAFLEDHPSFDAAVVCREPRARRISLGRGQAAHILPWKDFLDKLWAGKITGGKTVPEPG